jgi:hypothetical protein
VICDEGYAKFRPHLFNRFRHSVDHFHVLLLHTHLTAGRATTPTPFHDICSPEVKHVPFVFRREFNSVLANDPDRLFV